MSIEHEGTWKLLKELEIIQKNDYVENHNSKISNKWSVVDKKWVGKPYHFLDHNGYGKRKMTSSTFDKILVEVESVANYMYFLVEKLDLPIKKCNIKHCTDNLYKALNLLPK